MKVSKTRNITYSLELEAPENFALFAIKSNIEDYRLAYFINKQLGIKLHHAPSLQIKSVKGEGFFGHFHYNDIENQCNWRLIANKSYIHKTNLVDSSFDLFSNEDISTEIYFLPEYKHIDFFLYRDDLENYFNQDTITVQVKQNQLISSVFPVDIDSIKHIENLIF